VDEVLRLPFPSPQTADDPARAAKIIEESAAIVQQAMRDAQGALVYREQLVEEAQEKLNRLIYEYFDIAPNEQILIDEAVRVSLQSFRPGTLRSSIPAIEPSTPNDRERYTNRLCETLNGWSGDGRVRVTARLPSVSSEAGIGVVTLERTTGAAKMSAQVKSNGDLFRALDKLRDSVSIKGNTFELARGVKVFDGPRLYVVKPLGLRYWSETAALNDADEIAGSILMQVSEAHA
jgi:hypothetical protein